MRTSDENSRNASKVGWSVPTASRILVLTMGLIGCIVEMRCEAVAQIPSRWVSEPTMGATLPEWRQESETPEVPVVRLLAGAEQAALEEGRDAIPAIGVDVSQPLHYSAAEIACIAARQSSLGSLLQRRSQQIRDARTGVGEPAVSHVAIEFLRLESVWQSQQSARQALKLHYGLLAVEQALPLLKEAMEFVEEVRGAQRRAIDEGIPIHDPTKLDLTFHQLRDLEALQVLLSSQIRTKLALLVPRDIACHYHPTADLGGECCDDLCQAMEYGLAHRADLLAFRKAGSDMCEEDLEWLGNAIREKLGGGQSLLLQVTKNWLDLFRPLKRRERALDFAKQKCQVQEFSRMLDRMASNAMETAWQQRRTAVERLRIADDLVLVRGVRREQLLAMKELGRPFPADEVEAILDWYLERAKRIERQNEVYQSTVDWMAETGLLPCCP